LLIATTASGQAQQKAKVYRLAIVDPLNPVTDITAAGELPYYRGFFERLQELGFDEGRNLRIERYSGEGNSEHFVEMISQVVDLNQT
jgi:putative ABC transport system substrate-binding protein